MSKPKLPKQLILSFRHNYDGTQNCVSQDSGFPPFLNFCFSSGSLPCRQPKDFPSIQPALYTVFPLSFLAVQWALLTHKTKIRT